MLDHLTGFSMYSLSVLERLRTLNSYLVVVLTYIGDIIAYRHGLHFCREVNPYRNQNKV